MGNAFGRYRDFVNSTGFTCYACNGEFDSYAIDVLGARVFKVAGHSLCTNCYEDFDYHMGLLSTVLTELVPINTKQCLACWFSPCRCNK